MAIPLLAAIGGIAAAGIGAISNFIGQSNTNQANRDIAREQMAFQERMSGTAYQRATDDMRMAGINPALAYMQGGASSPGGASATMQDAVGPAVSSAMQGLRLKKELELMDAQRRKVEYETEGVRADTLLKLATGPDVPSLPAGSRAVPVARMLQSYQLRQAQIEATRSGGRMRDVEATLGRLSMPAAGVRGSKAAEYLRLLFGGGAVPGAANVIKRPVNFTRGRPRFQGANR